MTVERVVRIWSYSSRFVPSLVFINGPIKFVFIYREQNRCNDSLRSVFTERMDLRDSLMEFVGEVMLRTVSYRSGV